MIYCLPFFFPAAAPNHCFKCEQKDVSSVGISHRVHFRKCVFFLKKKTFSRSLREAFPFSHTGPTLVISQTTDFTKRFYFPLAK